MSQFSFRGAILAVSGVCAVSALSFVACESPIELASPLDAGWGAAGEGGSSASGGHAGSAGKAGGGQGGSGQGGSSVGGGAGEAGSNAGGSGLGGNGGTVQDASDEPQPDVIFGYDAPIEDSARNPDSACGTSKYEATLTPLDMYVMIDRSGSMVEPGYSWTATGPGEISINGGDCSYTAGQNPINSKWCYSIYALMGYFKSAEAVGNRVALQYYPIDGYNCSSASNNTLSSAAVGWQHLPGGNSALMNSLNLATPLGAFTPTKAALYGIAGFTSTHQTQGRITVGVLVTDGKPNSCAPDDGDTLGNVAQAHLTATGIKTYVIGMTGAVFDTLETIAEHGGAPAHQQYCAAGTNQCHYYNVGNGDGQVFVDVLKKIQQNAIACTYQLPNTGGGLPDLNKISVEYEPGNGGAVQPLTKVANANACQADSWYFDSNDPPNVILCPQTCTEVQADLQAKVQILVACQGN